jgi:polyisoprenoid-binding protein YceI
MKGRCASWATACGAPWAQPGGMRPGSRTTAVALVVLGAVTFMTSGAIAAASSNAWLATGEVRYLARDALTSWSGVAPVDELRLSFDPRDPGSLRLEARVQPAAFDSGNRLRDGRARASVFETDAFPDAWLVAAAAEDGAPPAPALEPGRALTLTLDAELTLHGVTLPYRIEARLSATRDAAGDPSYRAEADFEVSLTAHGMRRPTLLTLVTDDLVRVSLVATARPDPAPSSTTR